MHELPPTLATAAQIGVPVIEVSHVSTRFGTAVVHLSLIHISEPTRPY